MTKWLRRMRGAIGMGLTWAIGWAIAGVLIGVSSLLLPFLPWDAFFEFFDAPLPALAMPGFVGGVIFSIVLGIVGRRRRFDELSMPRFAAWGAAGGLLLSMVPDAMLAVGLASRGEGSAHGPWEIAAVIAGPLMFLCAASAAGSLALARRTQSREHTGDLDDAIDAELGEGEAQRQLGAGAGFSTRSRSASASRSHSTPPLAGRQS